MHSITDDGGSDMEYKVIDTTNFTEDEKIKIERVLEQIRMERKERVWKSKQDVTYYGRNSYGMITQDEWCEDIVDRGAWEIGNVFKTEKEARIDLEAQKIKTELERYAMMYNDPKKKWGENEHYSVCWDYHNKRIAYKTNVFCKGCEVYFTSKDDLMRAVEIIGKDRVKKYYLKVQEMEGEEDEREYI